MIAIKYRSRSALVSSVFFVVFGTIFLVSMPLNGQEKPSSNLGDLNELLELAGEEDAGKVNAQMPTDGDKKSISLTNIRQSMVDVSTALNSNAEAAAILTQQQSIADALKQLLNQDGKRNQKDRKESESIMQGLQKEQADSTGEKGNPKRSGGQETGESNESAGEQGDGSNEDGKATDGSQQKSSSSGPTPDSKSGQPFTNDVQTLDAVEMQKAIWGHMPEKIREQMQSQMVEEFLPSFRPQIEAYYRSLLNDAN